MQDSVPGYHARFDLERPSGKLANGCPTLFNRLGCHLGAGHRSVCRRRGELGLVGARFPSPCETTPPGRAQAFPVRRAVQMGCVRLAHPQRRGPAAAPTAHSGLLACRYGAAFSRFDPRRDRFFLSSLDSLRSAVQRTAGFVHLGLLLRDSLTLFCRVNPYSHSLYFCGDELPLCYHFCTIRCDHGVFLPSQNLNAGFFNRSLKRLLKRG